MKVTLRTVKVIKGEFKGKVLKTFEPTIYISGITGSHIACFDDDGTEYCMYWENVKCIDAKEIEVPDPIDRQR